jgi:hypothetical protein
MRKLFFIIAIITMNSASAQIAEWGEDIKLEIVQSGMMSYPIAGYDMVSFTETEVIKYLDSKPYPGYEYLKDGKMSIIVYDIENLKMKEQFDFKINDYLAEKEHYMGMTFIDHKAQVIVSKKNEDSRLDLYTRDLSTEAPYIGEKNKTIGVIDRYKLLEDALHYNMYETESPNEKLRAYYSFYKNPEDQGLKHRVCINDEDAKSWETFEYETPGNKRFYPSYFEMGNTGNIAVVGYDSQSSAKFQPKKMTVFYKFNGADFKTYEIELDEHYLISTSIISTDHDEILLYGHYTTKLGKGVNGWFTQSIAPGSVGDVKYHSYEDDFIMELWNEKSTSWEIKNHASDPYYTTTEAPSIYSCEDKSKMLVFTVTQDKDLVDKEYTEDKYPNVRDHIVVLKLDSEGEIIWKKNLFTNRKEVNMQDLFDDVSRSFNSFFINEKVYLIFNENYDGDEAFDYKTRMISIDQEGEVKEEYEDFKTKKDFVLRPEYCHYYYGEYLFGYQPNKGGQKIGFIELAE